jgi:LmbE family N-acetylglucosaminyl deacetylase
MRSTDDASMCATLDADVPLTTVTALSGDRAIVVLAPHPDDESLGCGVLLAQGFERATGTAHVICLTDGAASHPGSHAVPAGRLATIRRQETELALMLLGGLPANLTFLGAPDGTLVATPEIIAKVVSVARDCGAGVLMAPSPLDPHCDHVVGAQIGRMAAARLGDVQLGFYPIWSRWHGGGHAPVPEGMRSVRLSSSGYAAQKAAAIAAHASQQGLIVPDAPDGFEMPPGFAGFFSERDEIYFLLAAPQAGT